MPPNPHTGPVVQIPNNLNLTSVQAKQIRFQWLVDSLNGAKDSQLIRNTIGAIGKLNLDEARDFIIATVLNPANSGITKAAVDYINSKEGKVIRTNLIARLNTATPAQIVKAEKILRAADPSEIDNLFHSKISENNPDQDVLDLIVSIKLSQNLQPELSSLFSAKLPDLQQSLVRAVLGNEKDESKVKAVGLLFSSGAFDTALLDQLKAASHSPAVQIAIIKSLDPAVETDYIKQSGLASSKADVRYAAICKLAGSNSAEILTDIANYISNEIGARSDEDFLSLIKDIRRLNSSEAFMCIFKLCFDDMSPSRQASMFSLLKMNEIEPDIISMLKPAIRGNSEDFAKALAEAGRADIYTLIVNTFYDSFKHADRLTWFSNCRFDLDAAAILRLGKFITAQSIKEEGVSIDALAFVYSRTFKDLESSRISDLFKAGITEIIPNAAEAILDHPRNQMPKSAVEKALALPGSAFTPRRIQNLEFILRTTRISALSESYADLHRLFRETKNNYFQTLVRKCGFFLSLTYSGYNPVSNPGLTIEKQQAHINCMRVFMRNIKNSELLSLLKARKPHWQYLPLEIRELLEKKMDGFLAGGTMIGAMQNAAGRISQSTHSTHLQILALRGISDPQIIQDLTNIIQNSNDLKCVKQAAKVLIYAVPSSAAKIILDIVTPGRHDAGRFRSLFWRQYSNKIAPALTSDTFDQKQKKLADFYRRQYILAAIHEDADFARNSWKARINHFGIPKPYFPISDVLEVDFLPSQLRGTGLFQRLLATLNF